MKFSFGFNFFDRPMIIINIISLVFAVTYLASSDTTALFMAFVGFFAVVLLRILSKIYKEFTVYVGDRDFTVVLDGRSLKLSWSDIKRIYEDRYGLNFIRRDGLELPILKQIDNYEKFKALVIQKAKEYSIPFEKEEGER